MKTTPSAAHEAHDAAATRAEPAPDARPLETRKAFVPPRLDRHAPLPAVTAGSVMI